MSVRIQRNGKALIHFKYRDREDPSKRRTFNRAFFLSETDARALEPELIRAANEGKLDELLTLAEQKPTTRRSFRAVALQYIAVHTKAAEKPGGGFSRDATSIVNCHLIPHFGDKSIGSFRRIDLESFRAEMREAISPRGKTYSMKTIYNIEVVLRGILKWAWECGYAPFNAATLLPAIRKKDYENLDFDNFYNPEEMVLALDALRAHEDRVANELEFRRFWLPWSLILEFLCETGVRVGELAALTKFDFKRRDLTIRVCKAIYGDAVQSTKGDNDRTVPVSDELAKRLEQHVANSDPGSTLLFPNSGGGYLSSNSFDAVLDWLSENVVVETVADVHGNGTPTMLKRITPHGFRHSCGTLLAMADVTEEKIRIHLGHADTQMVRRYVHLAKAADHELNQRLTSLIQGARDRLVSRNESETKEQKK